MIRLAKNEEIDQILEITRACAFKMIANGIHQWNDDYPSREAFEHDVKRKELYVLENDGNLWGSIVISTFKDLIYHNVKWLTENDKPSIYIHRLAVHPDSQGQGNAQKLMLFAENWAIKGNFQSVRLDTFSQNTRNNRFYEQRGYHKLGNVYFPKQSKHPFYCYELPLNS
jgi:ribosomal protein S18 acetylase RimI-like enzyme